MSAGEVTAINDSYHLQYNTWVNALSMLQCLPAFAQGEKRALKGKIRLQELNIEPSGRVTYVKTGSLPLEG